MTLASYADRVCQVLAAQPEPAILVGHSMGGMVISQAAEQCPERFGQLPRVYIECLQDRAIGPALQQRMYTAMPCQQAISLQTGHSPFYAAPEQLARELSALAAVPA